MIACPSSFNVAFLSSPRLWSHPMVEPYAITIPMQPSMPWTDQWTLAVKSAFPITICIMLAFTEWKYTNIITTMVHPYITVLVHQVHKACFTHQPWVSHVIWPTPSCTLLGFFPDAQQATYVSITNCSHCEDWPQCWSLLLNKLLCLHEWEHCSFWPAKCHRALHMEGAFLDQCFDLTVDLF